MAETNSSGTGTTIPKALRWIWPISGAGSPDGARSSGTPTGQKKKNPTKSKATKKPSPTQAKASIKKPADTETTPAATDSEAGPGPSSEESQPPSIVPQQGDIDVPGKANASAAATAGDPGEPSLPQEPSDEVSAQSDLEKKVDASVSSFVEGQNPVDGTEEPLDDIKKDIVASLKELENSENAEPVLLSAADTAASLIAANLPEVDQNSDSAAASLPDGSTKSLQANNDSNDPLEASSDKPNEPADANKPQSDAAEIAQGTPFSSEEADVSSGKPTDSSANPATSDANTTENGPAGQGPKAQKPPVPKILIEAASDATDDDFPLDIPHTQTVPRAVPSVSAIPSEVIPEIAEDLDEPETPKLRKRKLYLRKMRNIALQKPILDAALGRQLATETKRVLELLARGEPYGLSSEVLDVADPVDAAPGATDPGDLAEVDANAADPTPSATDATDSPKFGADSVVAAPGATDPAHSAEVDANDTDPIPSATDATDSPKVAADPVDMAPGGTNPDQSRKVDANAADPAQITAANDTDLAEVDANAADPVPGAENHPDSSNVSVDPVDVSSSAIGPVGSTEVDANAADPAPSAAADATDSSNVAAGPIDSAPDASDTTGSDVVNADAANPASGAVGAPSLPGAATDAADPAPAAADTSDPVPFAADTSGSVQALETTDSAPTAANTSSSIQPSK